MVSSVLRDVHRIALALDQKMNMAKAALRGCISRRTERWGPEATGSPVEGSRGAQWVAAAASAPAPDPQPQHKFIVGDTRVLNYTSILLVHSLPHPQAVQPCCNVRLRGEITRFTEFPSGAWCTPCWSPERIAAMGGEMLDV